MTKEKEKQRKLLLHHKILLGMLLGVPAGLLMRQLPFFMENIQWVKLPGEIFLNLIVMIVAPLVFASILAGTASLGDLRKLGRIGGRTFIFYMLTTTVAITIGLVLVNIIKPGLSVSPEARTNLISEFQQDAGVKLELAEKKPDTIKLIKDIIPINPFRSLSGVVEGEERNVVAGNTMLQIIFFALVFGVGITVIKEKHRRILIDFFDAVTEVMIALVRLIMKMAPLGVFSLIAAVLATLGGEFIGVLLVYTLTVILGLVLHALITYNFVIKYLAGFKSMKFFRKIQSVMLLAFSTSSSGATLPVSMNTAENELGVHKEVSSFVLPLGATINMDGTALYQAVAAVFIAQVFGIDLSLSGQLTIILTATLASIGTAGVPAVGMIMLIIVLQTINIPVEGIALILGVDRLLDMCRTTLNVTGDLTASVLMDRMEYGKKNVD